MEILVIDDDRALCRTLQVQLAVAGHETRTAGTGREGIEMAGSWKPPAIILDVHLAGASGIELIPDLFRESPGSSIIIVTGDPENVIVSEAMLAGAFDYLRKPFDLDELTALVDRIARERETGRGGPDCREEGDAVSGSFVGTGKATIGLHKRIGLLARSRVPVLIEGESGTGKEVAARLLHRMSAGDGNFVALNCSAIVPTLIESELFGHEKGAFTGAGSAKIGKLEHAGAGTIFFDEIGDLCKEMQAKLLRVIQEEEFVSVGGLDPRPLRARIVAATHRDLNSLVEAGTFREDLYFRLNVAQIELKPLRERREDLPALTGHLLSRLNRRFGRTVSLPGSDIMKMILEYRWPGNVRELENLLSRAMAMAPGNRLEREEFTAYFSERSCGESRPGSDMTLAEAEKKHIRMSLDRFGWNISKTARMLDISPTTLRKKIGDFNLRPGRRTEDG